MKIERVTIKIITRFLPLVSFIFLLIGCNKDFLDITPTDRISNESILSDSTLFEDYVIARYLGTTQTDKEGEGTPPGFGRGFEYALWSSLTDESIYNNDDDTWIIQQGLISPENTGIAGTFWGRSYRGIREVNFALNNLADVEMSDGHKKLLRAELRFIRAFRYQDLIRNYGEIVLIGDRVSQMDDDLTDHSLFDKSSIPEAISYVVEELNDVIEDLPEQNSNIWQLGRATKGAAMALKSRILLYSASPLYNSGSTDNEKWQKAASAAKDIIDSGMYSLYPNYGDLFLDTGSNNNEIIFARYYNLDALHVAMEIANGPNGYSGWGGNVPLGNLVDDYEMADGSPFDWNDSEMASNPYDNRDPRFYSTILFNGAEYRGRKVETYIPGGRDSRDGIDDWNTSASGYYLRKFINEDLPIINPWGVAGTQDWIYFRYGEVLLSYAEAQNEAIGPDQTVYDAVNQIRERAGMPALESGLSQEEMRDRIRHERRIELAFEEHRYYDVRRWMIADDVENEPARGIRVEKDGDGKLIYHEKTALDGKSFNERNYWLPIPRREILASDDQLEQNPGY